MENSLADWDRVVAPILHELEDKSRYISYQAEGMLRALAFLGQRPVWETKAEAEIERAIGDLEKIGIRIAAIVVALEEIRRLYQDKPVGVA